MKKLLLTGILLSASQLTTGQTLTSYNLKAYKSGYTSVDNLDTIQTFAPDAGGTGKSWNFSTLVSHVKDTVAYIPVTGTPFASTYPTSTVVEYSTTGNRYDYYTLSNDGIYANSFSGNFPGVGDFKAKFTTPLKLIALPASFGNTWTSTNTAIVGQKGPSPLDSTRATITVNTSSEVDASGSLTTPASAYATALRIKTYLKATIKVELKVPFLGWQNSPETVPDRYDTLYNWVAEGVEVLTLTKDPSITTGRTYYASYASAYITTGVENIFIPGVSLVLFPNPAQDRFHVSGVRKVVSITDLTGKEVSFVSNSTASGMVEVQLSIPEKGLYTVQAVDNQGVKKALRFTVVK